jgi:hypothetical protein
MWVAAFSQNNVANNSSREGRLGESAADPLYLDSIYRH